MQTKRGSGNVLFIRALLIVPTAVLTLASTARAGECVGSGTGDVDGSGFVDLADLASWPGCATGPGGGTIGLPCCPLDLNGSGTIDLLDYSMVQTAFGNCVSDAACNVGLYCSDAFTCLGGECVARSAPCDACTDSALIGGTGNFAFDNSSATEDGLIHTACVIFQEGRIDKDVWACWEAPCNGTVFVSSCELTLADTKLAVYDGCECPGTDERLLSCDDDTCDTQSVVSFEAVRGQSYLLRVGVFADQPGGTGSVQISCGLPACPAPGDCFAAHLNGGCNDGACCETVCANDPFCCASEWDQVCADEADGYCGAGFDACTAGAGSCDLPDGNGTPGCDDIECCNAVCREDPFCCGVGGEMGVWDGLCAELSAAVCLNACGPLQGDCFVLNGTPGCDDVNCCAEVCPRDPFCCQVEWDDTCAESAIALCEPPPP